MAGDSEYQKQIEGNATVFNVKPAARPKYVYLILAGVLFVVIGLVGWGVFMAVMVAIGALAIAFGWIHDPRPRPFRKPSTFRVSPDAVESQGRIFPKDNIHRLLLRNGVTQRELLDEYITRADDDARLTYRARAARVANGLALEAGGESTLLAGGMDETTAYGLLLDTCRILGLHIE